MHNPSAFAFHLVSLVLTIPALFLNVEAFRLLGRLRTRLNPVMASYCWMLVSDFLLLIALTLRSGILVMWRPQDEG
jgi:TRAP-type mannitol/chloroaromatic compound transport system permease large subunit